MAAASRTLFGATSRSRARLLLGSPPRLCDLGEGEPQTAPSPLGGEGWGGGYLRAGVISPPSLALPHKGGGNSPSVGEVLRITSSPIATFPGSRVVLPITTSSRPAACSSRSSR